MRSQRRHLRQRVNEGVEQISMKVMATAQSERGVNRTLPRAYEHAPDKRISWLQRSTQGTAVRALRGFEPQMLAVDPILNPRGVLSPEATPDVLRLLSYNIQVGITTRRFRHYVTKGWKHV